MQRRLGIGGRIAAWIPCAATLGLVVAALGACQLAPRATAEPFRQTDMTVVVSVRHYLASAERSYYHLYLYSGDGTLVRQLTDADKMSDVDPDLSPDGKQVCFRRTPDYWYSSGTTGTYHLVPDIRAGSTAQRLEEAPDWYRPRKGADLPRAESSGAGDAQGYDETEQDPSKSIYRSADGVFSVVKRGSESGATFTLEDRLTSTVVTMETPTIDITFGASVQPLVLDTVSMNLEECNGDSAFLCQGALRVAFIGQHLNSTDGNCHLAYVLDQRKFVTLAPNGGCFVPAPRGVPGFFFVCGERYRSLDYANKKVNCDYLDFWNERMERTRFAPGLGKFGGAATYVPGHGVTVIPPDPYAQ